MTAYEILSLARNILLRAFVIGFLIVLLYNAFVFLGQEIWVNMLVGQMHIADRETLWEMLLFWNGVMRFFVIFILLVPALAIHWTLQSIEKI